MTLQEEMDARIITVVATRCQECAFRSDSIPTGDYSALRASIDAEWTRDGRAELIQWGWPKRYPASLIRQGFRCPFCNAPNLLLSVEADE